MESVIKTLLNTKVDDDSRDQVNETLQTLLSEEVQPLLSVPEKTYITYIQQVLKDSSLLPTESYFLISHGEYKPTLSQAKVLPITDLPVHLNLLIDVRTRQHVAQRLMAITPQIVEKGFTDDLKDQVDELYTIGKPDLEVSADPQSVDDVFAQYSLKESQPIGLKLGIQAIDDVVGSLTKGTVTVLFGFTGSGKSTVGTNIAYRNSYKEGYNIIYISLEMPRLDIIYNLISRHSFETKFNKYNYIAHDRIRKLKLNAQEKDYAFNTVYKDLIDNAKGRLIILDETDFKTFSKSEIRQKLAKLDKETPGGIDAVVWDQASLFKFTDVPTRKSDNEIINDYVSFIRKLSIKFTKDRTTGVYKQLCNIILCQANREGWKRAVKNGGRYDLRAIADANELERSAATILSVFTDENLKESKEAKMQVLKNRTGQTQLEPQSFFADFNAYTTGDELAGFNESLTSNDLDTMFDLGDLSGILEN